ncbi:MAG: cold shock protein, partial [Frankiales bacterium]|nr:cold shock protein [Frankiales bacterium]
MPTGKVKWYDPAKGFGFLSQDGGDDVYVHKSVLPAGVEEVKPGQRVEFGIAQGKRGEQALSVRILDPLPSVARATAAANRREP